MQISLAAQDDLAQIVEIYNDSIAERNATADLVPASVASRQAWFDAHKSNRPIYVLRERVPQNSKSHSNLAEPNTQILAWGSLSNYINRPAYDISAEISIYVRKSARGRGYGKILSEHLIAIAPKLGIKNILAVIFADNIASVKMFEKFGFLHWGRLPAVCDMAGELKDVVILGKKL